MVRVHYGEGVATHTGPESCTGGRQAVGEALTGEHAGQVLSGVSKFPGADAVGLTEYYLRSRLTHGSERPFDVLAAGTTVRAVGRARPEHRVDVRATEGSVQLATSA